MKGNLIGGIAGLACSLMVAGAERINQEGRILGPAPVVTLPTLFNSAAADAIVSAMQIFPRDNPWNEDVSRRPLLSNSDAMISQIAADLLSTRRTLRLFQEMNFVLVPDGQGLVPVDFFLYGDESDPSPYPLPTNLPVEGWPGVTGGLSLEEWQRDVNNAGGDRHAIVVQPGTGGLWEMWLTKRTDAGWEAANGARFDLGSNGLRPAGWTSGDAAGLAMFPALVRYDECQRGMVEHAMRLVVKRTRAEYLYPATHYASVPYSTDPNVPAMGQRLRLKASFVVPANWTVEERAVAAGLKKYGAIVADNGNFFSLSITPDDRWRADAFSHLSSLSITNFEVVQTSGPSEGPRSPGALGVDAGADRVVAPGVGLALTGGVTGGSGPVTVRWRVYSGPGGVVWDDPTRANAVATFSLPGSYVLMLGAEDGVHTPGYDALRVEVGEELRVRIVRDGSGVELQWSGGRAPYEVQESAALPVAAWNPVASLSTTSLVVNPGLGPRYYRVVGGN